LTSSSSIRGSMTPELRATVFTFTQFLAIGAATVYGSIWFASEGLSPEQIGIVNSAPVFVLLLLNIFVGRLADRASDWRQVIIVFSLASAAASAGLFFADGFPAILLVWSLINIAFGATGPVLDAGTMRLTQRRGTSYGAIRAWGTIGYVFTVFATGPLIAHFGNWFFVPLYVGLTAARALASLALPRFRGEDPTAVAKGAATHVFHMLKPWLFLPLLAWAMIQSTNVAMMAFQAVVLKQQGQSETLIGLLLALGAVAEAGVLYAYPWFKRKFTPEQLVFAAGIAAIVRWACFAFAPGMPWLVPLQMMNAITYGVGFLGIMSFITRWTAEDMAAEAQSVLGVLQQVMVIGMTTGFGYLYAARGVGAFWASTVMAGLGVVVLLLAVCWFRPPTTEPAKSAQPRLPA
jgi:PPP family 3-phenylpropionic acid transporter